MATTSTEPANTAAPKKAGPGLWLSTIITTIGLIAVSWGSWVAFDTAFELASIDSFDIPGEQTRDLSASQYEVYVRTSTVSIFELEIDDQDVSVDLDDITVTSAETGETVTLDPLRLTEPLGRSTSIFTPVASFEIDEPGRYTVAIDSADASRAVFGRTPEASMRASIPWAILGGIGLIVFIIGCVMLILGMVRRDRQKRELRATQEWAAYAAATAAPDVPTVASVAPPPPPRSTNPTSHTNPTSPPAPSAAASTTEAAPAGPPVSHAPHVEPHQSETETPW